MTQIPKSSFGPFQGSPASSGQGGALPPQKPGGGPSFPNPVGFSLKLPDGYLARGYFDEKGNPWPSVILEWPRDIADKLAQSRPQMTTAQLKGRFFAQVRRIEGKLDSLKDYDAVRQDVLKLEAFVEDAAKKNKVPDLFRQFIRANVKEAAKGEREFRRGFVNHFECVVAYFPEVRGK